MGAKEKYYLSLTNMLPNTSNYSYADRLKLKAISMTALFLVSLMWISSSRSYSDAANSATYLSELLALSLFLNPYTYSKPMYEHFKPLEPVIITVCPVGNSTRNVEGTGNVEGTENQPPYIIESNPEDPTDTASVALEDLDGTAVPITLTRSARSYNLTSAKPCLPRINEEDEGDEGDESDESENFDRAPVPITLRVATPYGNSISAEPCLPTTLEEPVYKEEEEEEYAHEHERENRGNGSQQPPPFFVTVSTVDQRLNSFTTYHQICHDIHVAFNGYFRSGDDIDDQSIINVTAYSRNLAAAGFYMISETGDVICHQCEVSYRYHHLYRFLSSCFIQQINRGLEAITGRGLLYTCIIHRRNCSYRTQ
ncbi:hypothetical protein ACH42_04005 [Endozoicomonas sp. (ex Bugula neritina AB1)]|nr:hypothetical protein ACH42_04005 [Endozoicomonas sp. (ex Bugula neritina AB1)]